MSDPTPEEQLLARIAAGGAGVDGAMKELVQAYERKLLRHLRSRGFSIEMAEDLLQDLWLTVLRRAESFETGRPVSPWLWGILDKLCLSAWRRHYRGERRDAPPVHPAGAGSDGDTEPPEDDFADPLAPTPESLLVLQGLRRCVARVFALFKRRHRRSAWLLAARDMYDWSVEEVAQARDSSVEATYTFLSTARRQIKPALLECLKRHAV